MTSGSCCAKATHTPYAGSANAGRVLDGALAHAVSLLNPSEIVVAGQLAVAGEHLVSGNREHVAARALPLATRDLKIRLSTMPNHAGVAGMADATATWLLQPAQLPAVLKRIGIGDSE